MGRLGVQKYLVHECGGMTSTIRTHGKVKENNWFHKVLTVLFLTWGPGRVNIETVGQEKKPWGLNI